MYYVFNTIHATVYLCALINYLNVIRKVLDNATIMLI